jgi:outer membrane biosynthesis protein TonB
MAALSQGDQNFKRALGISISLHLALFLLILLSPYFPKSQKKGMIHYVNVISFPGGGGGGGSSGAGSRTEEKLAETAVSQRETLRDLTTPQKLQQESLSTLRHPVEKPKRERKPPSEKKAVIQKAQKLPDSNSPKTSEGEDSGTGGGTGSGVRIGIGSGPGGGGGLGSGLASQIGLSNFPYTYYLQTIHGKISGNWYTSQISPGVTGNFQTIVYFKIFRNGGISALEIREQSGIRSLDLSALRAIQSSAPFPPLPNDYEGDFLGIHLIFEHNK